MSYYVAENNILGKTKPHNKRLRVIPVALKQPLTKVGIAIGVKANRIVLILSFIFK